MTWKDEFEIFPAKGELFERFERLSLIGLFTAFAAIQNGS